jgi:hypothetical protein
MSLVGSLEDLGLGDILQIIHLSRKSGVLVLRSDHGEGQIVFREGLIHGAFLKDGPTELRELLAARELLAPAALDAAWEDGHCRGVPVGQVLRDRGLMEADALDAIRREHVEGAVLRMFAWPSGEFSFEVREVEADGGEELFVSPGLNPQFLALEGTRQIDELQREEGPEACLAEPVFDGEGGALEPQARPAAGESSDAVHALCEPELLDPSGVPLEALGSAVLLEDEADEETPQARIEPAVEELAEAQLAEPEDPAELLDGAAAGALPVAVWTGPRPPVVVIESELAVLEWVKGALGPDHPRVHIFQHSDLGITRIRQYLARGEVPVVLIAADAPADPLSGARDVVEMVRRLKGHAARMPVLVLLAPGRDPPPALARGRIEHRPDAFASVPTLGHLADPRALPVRAELAEALRGAIEETLRTSWRGRGGPRTVASASAVARLRQVSDRIRDPSSRGEVLSQVLAFAAEHFARVALFMVRKDRAIGIAQRGLARAGGPSDAGLREVALPRDEPGWFRRVLATRAPVRGAPCDDGDQRLAVLLGNAIPAEAYVAPIESGREVVALLYADNLPGGAPLGDASALEIVLHEAGLALDRAVLERVLQEAEG